MKKIIIALMCVTVSVAAMAQPQKDNQKCDKPVCCQQMCCKDMGCGIDSTTMKTVMELRKNYHEGGQLSITSRDKRRNWIQTDTVEDNTGRSHLPPGQGHLRPPEAERSLELTLP